MQLNLASTIRTEAIATADKTILTHLSLSVLAAKPSKWIGSLTHILFVIVSE